MSADDVAWEKRVKFHLIEVVAYWEGRVTNDHLKRAFKINSRTTGSRRVMVISGVWKQVEGVAYPVG